jgi:NAD(P)-dependent dehydrogenase (short-subunit alcohol dehydrogenase family)
VDRLRDKVAVITGAGAGIGRSAAKLFAEEGAHVYVFGRRQGPLDEVVAEIGDRATAVRGDVTSAADLDHLYEVIGAAHGRVDIVYANAGGGAFARLGEITDEHIDESVALNLKGMIFTVQKALPLLVDGGSVIVVGSTSAEQGQEQLSLYAACKAAARSFSRTWANELRGRNIRVNTLTPGPTLTPGIEGCPPDMLAQFVADVPLGRFGQPEEVARAALFLASDESSFVTGAELCVDGGINQLLAGR